MPLFFGNAASDRVAYSVGAPFDGLTTGTYLALVKLPSAGAGAFRTIYAKGADDDRLFRINTGNRLQILHFRSGANLAGVADLTNFAAWAYDTWVWVAATFDTSASPVLYMGSRALDLAEPSAYVNQTAGSGTLNADEGAGNIGRNNGITDSMLGGDIAYFQWWNRALTLAELRLHQWEPGPSSGLVLWHLYNRPAASTQPDLSGNGHNGTVTGATYSEGVPVTLALGYDDSGESIGGTPVEASQACAWESEGLVIALSNPATESLDEAGASAASDFESLIATGAEHGTEWEWLEPVHRELTQDYEFLSARSQQLLTPEEHLGAPQRTNVTPWESGGEGGAVEASQDCGWEAQAGVEKSAITPHESLYTWPWGEKTVRRVALFVLASEQVPGQTVVSRIGPNGWLGDSPGDAVDDPTLDQNAPARWVMGQTPKRYLSWGDVLGDVFSSPRGFTLAVPFEVSQLGGLIDPGLFQKNAGLTKGVQLTLTSVGAGARIDWLLVYGATFSQLDNVNTGADPTLVREGRHLAAVHFDPTIPRATRNQIWLNGSPLVSTNFPSGADESVVLDTSGSLLRLGSAEGGSRETPESVHSLILVEGVLEPETHANMAQWFRDGGWEMPVEASSLHPWESEAAVDSEAAVAIEELAGVGASALMLWEADGNTAVGYLTFDVALRPGLDLNTSILPGLELETKVTPALELKAELRPSDTE